MVARVFRVPLDRKSTHRPCKDFQPLPNLGRDFGHGTSPFDDDVFSDAGHDLSPAQLRLLRRYLFNASAK
jgi:hypothetical protein